jgi:hypothetical protein
MMQRCYWNYLRILAPAGARLVAATPHSVGAQHLISGRPSPARVLAEPSVVGRQVFATFMLVPRGEVLETAFSFALPPGIVKAADGEPTEYSLTVQRQPGMRNVHATVEVTLPDGARLLRSEPEPSGHEGNVVSFDLHLSSDRTIRLAYR